MSRREQLEQLIQADPDDTFLKYALAMAYVSEGETQAGLDQFARVIAHEPKYVAAYFQQGQVLAKLGRTDEARSALERGIKAAEEAKDAHAAMEMVAFLESLE